MAFEEAAEREAPFADRSQDAKAEKRIAWRRSEIASAPCRREGRMQQARPMEDIDLAVREGAIDVERRRVRKCVVGDGARPCEPRIGRRRRGREGRRGGCVSQACNQHGPLPFRLYSTG